jgi:type I restriction enzyme R subunit
LNDDEVAFYEALEVNDSAVKVLGDETLKAIAREQEYVYRLDGEGVD